MSVPWVNLIALLAIFGAAITWITSSLTGRRDVEGTSSRPHGESTFYSCREKVPTRSDDIFERARSLARAPSSRRRRLSRWRRKSRRSASSTQKRDVWTSLPARRRQRARVLRARPSLTSLAHSATHPSAPCSFFPLPGVSRCVFTFYSRAARRIPLPNLSTPSRVPPRRLSRDVEYLFRATLEKNCSIAWPRSKMERARDRAGDGTGPRERRSVDSRRARAEGFREFRIPSVPRPPYVNSRKLVSARGTVIKSGRRRDNPSYISLLI